MLSKKKHISKIKDTGAASNHISKRTVHASNFESKLGQNSTRTNVSKKLLRMISHETDDSAKLPDCAQLGPMASDWSRVYPHISQRKFRRRKSMQDVIDIPTARRDFDIIKDHEQRPGRSEISESADLKFLRFPIPGIFFGNPQDPEQCDRITKSCMRFSLVLPFS